MKLLVLDGDGIGPEIVPAALDVLEAADRRFGLKLSYEHDAMGHAGIAKHNHALGPEVIAKAKALDAVIMGPHDSISYPDAHQGYPNPSSIMRRALDVYANMRPSKTRPGVPAKVDAMDLMMARENTEGFYPDRNHSAGMAEVMPNPDHAQSIRFISRKGTERIAEMACQWAMQRRKKVTVVHKASVLKITDGLFRGVSMEVCARYPEIEVDEILIDATAAALVRHPETFDVLIVENMIGDIYSDLAAELAGGLGVGGAVNCSMEKCMAQAAHGSAPDIAGQGIANPTGMILSCAMTLKWLAAKHDKPHFLEAGCAIEAAVDAQLAVGRTRDLGGDLSCDGFAKAVAERL